MLNTIGKFVYDSPEGVSAWAAIGARHQVRDERFLKAILPHFRPGTIHEAGAGCGHLAHILQRLGREVTCSDLASSFVQHMRDRGLRAERYDATMLDKVIDRRYDNILAQGVTPLVVRDRDTNEKTLRAIHGSLTPGGRLISIFAIKRDAYNKANYFQPDEQIAHTLASGLFKLVKVIPHQVTPPRYHTPANTRLLTFLDFQLAKIACVRKVMVWEKV